MANDTSTDHQRLSRRYRTTVGQCAANLSSDLAKFNPATPASPFQQDLARVKTMANHKRRIPCRRLLMLNLEQAYHKVANINDHLRALEAVFTLDPPSIYAPSSMARVTVEAAAGVNALLLASVDVKDRIVRGTSALLESYQHNLNATRSLPAAIYSPAVAEAQRKLEALVKLAERAGLEIRRQPAGKPTGIRWAGAARFSSVPYKSATDLITDAFAGYPALYQMTSGVAHSMEWMLGDNARIGAVGPPVMTYTSDPFANGAAAIAAIAAAEVVIAEFARYMGFDPEDVLAVYRIRREALDKYINDYAGRGIWKPKRI
jgi:hypothetical protein